MQPILLPFRPKDTPPSAAQYAWQSADILAFAGRGALSLGIQLGTCSRVSHIAAIAWTPRWQLQNLVAAGALNLPAERIAGWQDRFLLYESTSLNTRPCALTGKPLHGVQTQEPSQRVREYDGRVWRYRLSPAWRRDFNAERSTRLTGHLLARLGQPYDNAGAVLSGTRLMKHFWAWSRVDRSRLFCSEYLASVLQHVGLFPLANASKITPAGLIRRLVDAEVYLPGELIKD